MKKFLMVLLTILVVLPLSACTLKKSADQEPVELIISAAASLENAFNEIKPLYESQNEQIKLSFTFGGSGSLQQQISQGAPVDLFFSAAEDKFQLVVNEGLMNEEYQKDLLKNTLVLITPKYLESTISSTQDLANITDEHIAIGETDSVPAGKYAKQVLEKLSLWNKVKPNLIYAKDVSQVLNYVAQGNTEYGFVYKTDAISSDKIKIIETVDSSLHDSIIYPVGVLKNSEHEKEAIDFFTFLQTEEAMNIFNSYGFTAVE